MLTPALGSPLPSGCASSASLWLLWPKSSRAPLLNPAAPCLISLCVALDTVVPFPPQYMFFLQRVPRLTALLVFHCLPECRLSSATTLQSSSPRSVPESSVLALDLIIHLPETSSAWETLASHAPLVHSQPVISPSATHPALPLTPIAQLRK